MAKKITRRNLKQGMFAFVDLLGFSDRVRAINTEQQLRELDRDVGIVQSQFEHKAPDTFVKKSQQLMGKRVFAFSDCVVISVPLISQLTKLQGGFDVLMSELQSFALAQGECIVNNIFIRGGVDLGYWFQKKDTLISPAMVNAYELEKAASVPMIAITPALRKYLSKHSHRKYYGTNPLNNMIKQKRNLPNGKTQWFINYLPQCLESIEPVFNAIEICEYKKLGAAEQDKLRTQRYYDACMVWAGKHRDAIAVAHAATKVESVQKKYEWLAKYHNQEIKSFFGPSAASLLLNL